MPFPHFQTAVVYIEIVFHQVTYSDDSQIFLTYGSPRTLLLATYGVPLQE